MRQRKGWYWFVLVLTVGMDIPAVQAQCNAKQEDYHSPNGEPYFITEKVVPGELLYNMFRYLQLLRNEFWYSATENITITRAGVPSCIFVGCGVGLEEVKNLNQKWEIPLLTNVQIIGEKIFIPGKRNTFATIEQFENLIKILDLKSTIILDKDPRIVVEVSKKTVKL